MRTVLVAVDDSAESERVAGFVNDFFGDLPVQIIGVNIGYAPLSWGPYAAVPGGLYAWPYLPPVPAPAPVPATDDAMDAVHDRGARTIGRSALRADETVVEIGGDVASSLQHIAEEQGADLLVVGSSEKGLLERLFSPSVSVELAKSASVPVLVVH